MAGGGVVNRRDVDGGWAWVVLMASFLSSAIIYGFAFNGGIYFVTFLNVFGQSRGYTALVYAVQMTAIHVGGPVSSWMLRQFGPRPTLMFGSLLVTLCLTTSFFAVSIPMLAALFGFAGLGTVMVMTSNVAAMSLYFDEYYCAATGLTNSGAGVGMSGMGALIEWTIDAFGWRGSMLILAGVVLQSTLCGALIYNLPEETMGRSRDTVHREVTLRVLSKDPRWYMVFLNLLLYYFSWNIVLLIIKDSFLAKDLPGISYQSAIVGFGVANTMGRFTSGFLNKYLLVPPLQNFVTSVATSVAILGVMAVTDQWPYVACVCVCSFCYGQLAVIQALSLAYIYGNEATPILWGYGVLSGVVCLGSTPATGYMVDISGSYKSVHVLASLCIFASGIFSLICYVFHRKNIKSMTDLVKDGDEIKENRFRLDETKPLADEKKLNSNY